MHGKFKFFTSPAHFTVSDRIRGEAISDVLRICNDTPRKAEIIAPDHQWWIGALELGQIYREGSVLFFAEWDGDIRTPDDHLSVLNYYMYLSRLFGLALWLVKDNSITFEAAFVSFRSTQDLKVTLNYWMFPAFTASGTREDVAFSRTEIDKAKALHALILRADKSSSGQAKDRPFIASHASSKRIDRAFYFLDAARLTKDIGVKLANYCVVLEALFSTDSSELSHKLSERIAVFAATGEQDRTSLFKTMKRAYTVRSKIVHGSIVNDRAHQEAAELSVQMDGTIRAILVRLLTDPSAEAIINRSNEGLDEYFLSILMS